jgi:predicted enzyme related to lactoylglutathione lyase
MTRQHGTPAWTELLTRDPEAAKAFFTASLGWRFEAFDLEDGAYWVIFAGDTLVGGMGSIESGDIETGESYWLTSIEVDDIDERWEQALAAGATAIRPPHDVPEVGRVALLRDPTGAPLGLMQSLPDTQ